MSDCTDGSSDALSDTDSLVSLFYFFYWAPLSAKTWLDHRASKISVNPCSLCPVQETVFGV